MRSGVYPNADKQIVSGEVAQHIVPARSKPEARASTGRHILALRVMRNRVCACRKLFNDEPRTSDVQLILGVLKLGSVARTVCADRDWRR
jgi:hypothetical protein